MTRIRDVIWTAVLAVVCAVAACAVAWLGGDKLDTLAVSLSISALTFAVLSLREGGGRSER